VPEIQRLNIAGLTTRIVGPADAKLTVVLLHGFGAPGDDLVALAQYIAAPARFVFPEAPIELGGLYGDARAWWRLDLMRLEEELRTGAIRDRRAEVPEGLAEARTQMVKFLDELQQKLSIDNSQLVLGGFSQGAMLSLDVALHREVPPAALILMSGTLLAESIWQPRMKRLAGVPVFQSHGVHDALLPFAIAEIMRDELREAGARLDWHEFHGGHEIPPSVLDGVATLIAATGSTSR
jgi:phospholipase/carboxylesterase